MRVKKVGYAGTSSEQVWQSMEVYIFSFSIQANQLISWNLLGTLNILERRRAMLDILVILWQQGAAGYWGMESGGQAFMQPGKGSTFPFPVFGTFNFVESKIESIMIYHQFTASEDKISQ